MVGIQNELITPVYLNQRIVFDMIAMLQGGISTVSRITSSESNTLQNSQDYGASFGLSKALSSLIRVDLSAKAQSGESTNQDIHKAEERVHTPSSLFQSLRSDIAQKNALHIDTPDYRPTIRDFVEFSVPVRRNPLIQMMDTFIQLIDITFTLQTGAQKKKQPQAPDQKSLLSVKKQMSDFIADLKTGTTVDVVTDTLRCGYSSVITLEREYLNNPSMSDLVDGNFNVLGKIIRVISDSSKSISLLRNSAVGAMPKGVLKQLLDSLSSISDTTDIDLPQMNIEIQGPVIQILPLAIFV